MLSCLIISSKVTVDRLHPSLKQILALAYQRLLQTKSTSTKIRLIEIFMAAFYYDANYTLSLFQHENPEIIAKLFETLFEWIKDMERDFTQRLIVLSFSALLCIPQERLPPIIVQNTFSMFRQIIRELVLIEEEAKKVDDSQEEESEDDSRFDRDDFGLDVDEDEFDEADSKLAALNRAKKLYVPDGGYDENEDCLNAEDEDYRQMLQEMDGEEKAKRELYLSGEPVDDEDENDFAYTSPIESFPITRMFVETFENLASQNPQFVTLLKNNLENEDASRLEELVISCRK